MNIVCIVQKTLYWTIDYCMLIMMCLINPFIARVNIQTYMYVAMAVKSFMKL